MNRSVLRRAFGLLGPLEAGLSMVAFLVSLAVVGWRRGGSFPTGHDLMAASGAAFLTVVLAQTANAFACRSSSVAPWTLGWTTNRLLIPAAAVGLAFSLTVLLVDPFARVLDQAPPPVVGVLVAVLSAPALLAVDALDKRIRRRHPAAEHQR
jgi:magnesium-transporting ATPase (P-type)